MSSVFTSIPDPAFVAARCKSFMAWKQLPEVQTYNIEMHDVFQVRHLRKTYYLKIYRNGIRTKRDLLDELALVDSLYKAGLPVSRPIFLGKSRIISFKFPEGTRFGILWQEVAGEGVSRTSPSVGTERKLGELIAKCHQVATAAKVKSPQKTFSSMTISENALSIADNHLNLDESLRKKIRQGCKMAASIDFSHLPTAICHGDAHFGNILVQTKGDISLIDFDLCLQAPRSYDLAVCLWERSAFITDEKKFAQYKKNLIKGYESISKLSQNEIDALPALILCRSLWVVSQLPWVECMVGAAKLKNSQPMMQRTLVSQITAVKNEMRF